MAKQCLDCGGTLIFKNGRNGNFFGCDNYPNCRYTEKADNMPTQQQKPFQNAPKREIHLTEEQIRTNALNAAIECAKLGDNTDRNELVKHFENYIRTGEI